MKNIIYIILFLLSLLGCSKDAIDNSDTGLYGLNNYIREFDFSDSTQLIDLPAFGEDHSYIENEQLKAPIKVNKHKGLGRKFWFENNGGEPNEAEIEFTIWLADNFQKNGVNDEVGKFPGFEGIYDRNAGWGGRKVTTQNSWSVRIVHAGENNEGKIPIGLYVYHPGMIDKYGTTINPNFLLNKEQYYSVKLYIRMNEINKENGILILSVDENEIYNSNSWRFRNENSVHIKSVCLDAYVGGPTPSLFDTYILIDNLKIKW
ncbi:MAG: hypothetical protein CR986_10445 [Ignavibacteriae bacterium]|nr:MAG: hypothetical protein CR986_10445 [Ignavibacteriota bacterium]